MKIVFSETGWDDYLYWAGTDQGMTAKLNRLIADISRHGHGGIGKPEPLRGGLAGWWSRRLDDKNRLVYRLAGVGAVEIIQCRGHYGDK